MGSNGMNTGAGVNPTMMALTPAQFAQLSPQDQQACLRGLSLQGQQQVMASIQAANIVDSNRRFMRQSVEKTAYCPVTGGSGVTAAYSAGTTLYFDLPTVPGFAKQLLIHYNLSVTPATGTNAAYAVNPGAPNNIFSELQVLYNGPQIRTHPVFLRDLDVMQGYQRGANGRVLAGNNDATNSAYLTGLTPITVGSANSWIGTITLRLNALGEDTVPGLLPIAGTGNKPQLKLTCAPAFVGLDPFLNPIAPTAGTGAAATVTGNINVDVAYLDGTTMDNPAPLSLAWQQEPTMQYYWDTALTPFTGGSVIQRQTISSKLKHWYVVSYVIDANQASAYAAISNLTGFEIGPDQVGQQTFVNWNISNNVSIQDYMKRNVRDVFGQDMLPGVIVWVAGPSRGVIDSDNRNGIQYLNMYPGGFPAATHSYQVGSVSGQGAVSGYSAPTPRVETFLISENAAGLRVS